MSIERQFESKMFTSSGEMKVEWRRTVVGPPSEYRRASQCMRAIRSPGNVKRAPMEPHHRAMKNLSTSLDAGPLKRARFREMKNLVSNTLGSWYPYSKLMRHTSNRVLHFPPEKLQPICWNWHKLHLSQTPEYLLEQSGSSWRRGGRRSPLRWPEIVHPHSLRRRSRGRWVKRGSCKQIQPQANTTTCSSWPRLRPSTEASWCRPEIVEFFMNTFCTRIIFYK